MTEEESKDQEIEAPTGSLAERLGVQGLMQEKAAIDGRFMDAAGSASPVAEFTADALVLHPVQKPLQDEGPCEVISLLADERGVLLDDNGMPKKIPSVKFNGHEIFWLAERKPGTFKHYGAWFDKHNKAHKLYFKDEVLTCDLIVRLRNRTHNGEISTFAEITSDV